MTWSGLVAELRALRIFSNPSQRYQTVGPRWPWQLGTTVPLLLWNPCFFVMCLVPLLRTGSQTCTNSHLCHSNGCLIPENTLTTTVHMQIMPSLAHTICIKSLWKDAYVSLPTAYFMPVYLWRRNKTILCKGMLLLNSPYAVTDRILDLVGHWFMFLIMVDNTQQPHTVIVSLQNFQLQVWC